jgi:hypothetical protein
MATRGGTRLLIATGEAAASEDELPRLVRAPIELLDQIGGSGIPITVFELDRAGRPPVRA